ncbi:MAG: DUF917 domain-containing protein [Candidatus Dormibacteraceae bacterium]
MARLITEEDLEDIARGAAILGTGGGGSPYIGKLLAQAAIRRHGPVTLVSAEEVPDDALVAQGAMMGAPTVMVEKIPQGDEVVHAFRALGDRLGRPLTHVTCGEVGGVNSTIPFVVAATLGIPLVDADAMGRAFPELQMTLTGMAGITATPLALADDKGNRLALDTIDNRWTERLARTATIEMGCSSLIAFYSCSGRQARDSMVLGSISLTQELGRLLRDARARHDDPIQALLDRLRGKRLFGGRVVDVSRRTEAGFARGTARFAGLDADSGATLTLEFQNENLVAVRDGKVLATVPDLIVALDSETGEPVTTEELRYGFRLTVIGVPCDPRWRLPQGLALAGPRYFGYDVDYEPVEERA